MTFRQTRIDNGSRRKTGGLATTQRSTRSATVRKNCRVGRSITVPLRIETFARLQLHKRPALISEGAGFGLCPSAFAAQ
jgi:hypothetical protein